MTTENTSASAWTALDRTITIRELLHAGLDATTVWAGYRQSTLRETYQREGIARFVQELCEGYGVDEETAAELAEAWFAAKAH